MSIKGMSFAMRKLFNRKLSYQAVFLNDRGQLRVEAEPMMADLKRFCCVETSTARVASGSGTLDPIAMAMAEGRREVFNRIQSYLHLSDEQIFKLTEGVNNDSN